jgi:hypothetical protein
LLATIWGSVTSFLGSLEPDDWVAAGVAIWSVMIAAKATRISADALGDQKVAREADRRSSYYQGVVLDVCVTAIAEFGKRASSLSRETEKRVGALGAEQSHASFVAVVQEAIREYRLLQDELVLVLITTLQAWGDDELTERVNTLLFETEDTLTKAFGSLTSPDHTYGRLVTEVKKATSDLLGALVQYDLPASEKPQHRQSSSQRLLGGDR